MQYQLGCQWDLRELEAESCSVRIKSDRSGHHSILIVDLKSDAWGTNHFQSDSVEDMK